MPNPLTLATLAVLTAAGSVTGLYLGHSAIAEINPAFYDEPETRFHADLVPNPPGFDAPPVTRAGYVSPAEYGQAFGRGCVGCLTYPEEYRPVHDSSVDEYRPRYAEMNTPAPRPAAETMEVPGPVEQERAADFALVGRYAAPEAVEEPAAEELPTEEPAVEATPAAAVELASAEGNPAE